MTVTPLDLTALRTRARLLSSPATPPPDFTWARYRYEIRKDMLEQDIEDFTHWPTITCTMFVANAPYIDREWKTIAPYPRYRKAAEEYPLGRPILFRDSRASGNSIHQTYHLSQWEAWSGIKAEQLERVVEFGGGFGSMRARFERLGYTGQYNLYDTPEFSLLQEWYLSNLGIPAIYCPLERDRFRPLDPGCDLLIACYSLSEVSPELRTAFFDSAAPQNVLIASQDGYGGEGLEVSWKQFTARRPNYHWEFQEITSLPGHFYLFGEKL